MDQPIALERPRRDRQQSLLVSKAETADRPGAELHLPRDRPGRRPHDDAGGVSEDLLVAPHGQLAGAQQIKRQAVQMQLGEGKFVRRPEAQAYGRLDPLADGTPNTSEGSDRGPDTRPTHFNLPQ